MWAPAVNGGSACALVSSICLIDGVIAVTLATSRFSDTLNSPTNSPTKKPAAVLPEAGYGRPEPALL
jgi:hypothetical protein